MSIYDPMLDNDVPRASNWDKLPCTTLKSLTAAERYTIDAIEFIR